MTLDMRGRPCPLPVVEVKKAVKSGAHEVVILVDNADSAQNLKKFAMGSGLSYSLISEQDLYTVTLTQVEVQLSESGLKPESKKAQTSQNPLGRGPVIVIGGETMGHGDEALGRILIKSFIYSLTVLEPQPECIIFYNSGVMLVTGDSALLDLKTLEAKGVEVIACGACCNYFGVTDKLCVGKITDMYAITDRMAKAARLINI